MPDSNGQPLFYTDTVNNPASSPIRAGFPQGCRNCRNFWSDALRLWEGMTTADFVRAVCDYLIPMQVALWVQEPVLKERTKPLTRNIRDSLPFLVRSGLIIAVVVGLAEWGKHVDIWREHPGFPSGHATMCSSLSTVLLLHRGWRWAVLLVPMALAMPVALVLHRAHSPTESAGGFFFGIVATLALWRLSERFMGGDGQDSGSGAT